MRKELAEIYCKAIGNGDYEMRIRGMADEVFSMAMNMLDSIAETHAQQVGAPKWCALMAMADTLRDMAEEDVHEDGRLS